MATVSERMRRRIFRRTEPRTAPPARRRRTKWLLGAAGALLVLLWLLPVLIAHSPLLNWIVGMATSDLRGEVRIGSASLGWFSPIRLENVEVRAEDGETLAVVPRVSGDRALLKILWDFSRLGRFQVEGPEVTLAVRPDGSNLEDALAAYVAPGDGASKPVDLGLDVANGVLAITDSRTNRSWRIENVRLRLGLFSDPARPLELECSGETAGAPQRGAFSVALKLGGTADPAGGSEGVAASRADVTVRTEQFPLALADALLARLDPHTRLDGRLGSALQCQWSGPEGTGQAVVRGSLTAEDFVLSTPSLGADTLRLKELNVKCDGAWQKDTLQIDQAVVQCDAGNVSAVGTLDLGAAAAERWLPALARQSYEVKGRVDLARLAALLPTTLSIQQGTEVTSGQLDLAVAARPGPDGMTWRARLNTSDLAAVNQEGRKLVWQQPVKLSLDARETAQGPVVDTLTCESDFLRVEASGTPDDLTAEARFDLDALAAQLAGFVDLRGVQMAGGGAAQLTWKRAPGNDFEADASVRLQDFRLAIPEWNVQVREDLGARLVAAGRTDFAQDRRIQSAAMVLQSGRDRLDVRLLEPVENPGADTVWALDVQMQGELADWLPRIRPWLALDDWDPAGAFALNVQGAGSSKAVEVRRAQLTVSQLRVRGHGLNVAEPRVDLVAEGRWDNQAGRLDLAQASLSAGSLAVQVDKAVLATGGETGAGLSGQLSFRGTLEQVQRWLDAGPGAPAWSVSGSFAGGGEVQKTGPTSAGTFGATVSDLVYATQSGTRFAQSQVRLGAKGAYDAASGVVQIEGAQIAGDGLGCTAGGRVTTGGQQAGLDLSGNLEYDWKKLAPVLQPYLGKSLKIAGRGVQAAGLRGPMDLTRAEGEAGLGWTTVAAYGFQGGPATLRGTLSRGSVQFQPLEMELNEGKLNLAASLRATPAPVELRVQKGSAARQVRITPEMCANALKYIAPVLADVAAAEGKFSIELDACRVPLADPAQSALKGRFIVHSVQVGPGPLVRELAVLLGREAPARLQKESVVPFQMADGRIYHEGLELVFPDLTIRTHGSVGLDQTLLLMAEMPVPPKWAALNPRVAAAMKDQAVRLPVNGTLSRPKIDQRALQQYTAQFIQKAAENAVQDELNRQFQRLFGPKP